MIMKKPKKSPPVQFEFYFTSDDDVSITSITKTDGEFLEGNKDESAEKVIIFNETKIYPISHEKKTNKRAAGREHGSKYVSVAKDMSWSIDEEFWDETFASNKKVQVIPFGAMVWSLGKSINPNISQIILLFDGLTRAITFSISTKEDGTVDEQIIFSKNPEQTLRREHDEILLIHLNKEGAVSLDDGVVPPEVTAVHDMSLTEFSSFIDKLNIGVKPGHQASFNVPIVFSVSMLVFSIIFTVLVYGSNYWLDGEEERLNNELQDKQKMIIKIKKDINGEWQNSINAYVDDKRIDLSPIFSYADKAAGVWEIKKIKWNNGGKITYNTTIPVTLGVLQTNQIIEDYRFEMSDCEVEDTFDVGKGRGGNEIAVIINCNM